MRCCWRSIVNVHSGRPCESGDLPCWMSRGGSTFPGLAGSKHGIGEDDEAAKHGDEGKFGRLAFGHEPFVKGPQDRIVPDGGDSGHVEDAANSRSTAMDSCGSGHGAALTDERSDPNKRCRRLVV